MFMVFFKQEYWSGLPFPLPRNLPDPGIVSKIYKQLMMLNSIKINKLIDK